MEREYTRPIVRRFVNAKGHEVVEIAAWFWDIIVRDDCVPDISTCPNCKGPADNGFDRCDPPN